MVKVASKHMNSLVNTMKKQREGEDTNGEGKI
jgi:hypothetical protein